MKEKLTTDQISEAKREVGDLVAQRHAHTTTVHSTSNLTVIFDEKGFMTILNGNCHELTDDRCIEFDVIFNHGFVDFRQNRFYNFD
jgi:hypothetical protein